MHGRSVAYGAVGVAAETGGTIPPMAPTTGTALVIIVAFALPGFVTVLLQERTFKHADDPTPLDRLLRILYYSVWSYLLLAIVALIVDVGTKDVRELYEDYKSDPAELVWRGALLVLIPSLLIATTTRAWQGSKWQAKVLGWLHINERHEEPTGWDFFFRQRHNVYVRIRLSNGGSVHGFYGAESFAAYSKDGGDLYLERLFVPGDENWFGSEALHHRGVWVKGDEVVLVEFYDPMDAEPKETNDATEETEAGGTAHRGSSTADRREPSSSAASVHAATQEGEVADG